MCLTNAKLSDIINKLICGDAGIGRQASLRCLCQYWRVGSSPISRTSVKDIRFSSVLYFISRQISKALSSKKATLESHEIFDFVVEETCFLSVKSMILRKRNLFRRLTKASPRCPSQYWRVGSSPISRTSVKDIRFSSVLYFISRQISKALSSKKATLESHEIFDFVVEETCFLSVKSMILRKRNLFRRLTKASPRCPSQYWRVGSSPISRTSVKDIRFSGVLYFYS